MSSKPTKETPNPNTNTNQTNHLTITPATTPDIPLLATINHLAYSSSLISKLTFTGDEATTTKFYRELLRGRIEDSGNWSGSGEEIGTRVFKAVEKGEVVGCVCLTVERGDGGGSRISLFGGKGEGEKGTGTGNEVDKDADAGKGEVAGKFEGLNPDLVKAETSRMAKLKSHITGKHYYISLFTVLPKYQGKGIGSQLLRFCLDIADGEGLNTWLIAMPESKGLYERYGFRVVAGEDLDLGRGLGVHRSFVMVRYPGVVRSRVEG